MGTEEKDILTKKYEVALVMRPSLEEAAVGAYFNALEKKIQDGGGTITTPARPSRIALAYPIKKNAEGYFGFILFESTPQFARELANNLRPEKDLLRYMIIRNDYGEQPSITDQSVRGREPRPIPTPAPTPATPSAPRTGHGHGIDNAELERKLEEILS